MWFIFSALTNVTSEREANKKKKQFSSLFWKLCGVVKVNQCGIVIADKNFIARPTCLERSYRFLGYRGRHVLIGLKVFFCCTNCAILCRFIGIIFLRQMHEKEGLPGWTICWYFTVYKIDVHFLAPLPNGFIKIVVCRKLLIFTILF